MHVCHFIGGSYAKSYCFHHGWESKAMRVTAHNNQRVLLICVAYTSHHEMMHAVHECCKEKWNDVQASKEAKLTNGAIARIDQGLKGNGFDLPFQDSCIDYQNATKACNNSEAEITSCNELVEMTEERKNKQGVVPLIKLVDIEKHMYMAVAPDPDILIRTSGEARPSNFLLWQTSTYPLYALTAVRPKIGLRHLVWAVLNFQRHHFYLEKKRKQF
ncbi:Dehydrodolichyl diphosphate synthase 6 [Glycine soja]|uniref:Dehydrodolichyl diphosphate synthase 6 n=1 Tax=Glycine soja TaxID=3848 RepID=A0A0B2PP64_GLYSO|nr:Dehydrodolichyl diphosphate synthase 6 [Glycine soja]